MSILVGGVEFGDGEELDDDEGLGDEEELGVVRGLNGGCERM